MPESKKLGMQMSGKYLYTLALQEVLKLLLVFWITYLEM